MACLNVLSQDNYINVNVTLAKLFGLHTAVYWAELSHVLSKVKKKNKFDENGFFILDRKYITSRTMLTEEEQIRCDHILVTAGVMAIDPKNDCRVSVDVKLILSLIIDGDTEEIEKKAKAITIAATPKTKKLSKTDAIKIGMKRYVTESDTNLVKAYDDWIDVIAEARRINRVAVETFQNTIQSYSSDKSIQQKLIEIATAHTYIDAHWAISVYEKLNVTNPSILKPQKVGTTVNNDISF